MHISHWSKQPSLLRKSRGKCNAKTRKGTLCQAPPIWKIGKDRAVNGRCKLHGGLSTGPKTEAGKKVIRESNRQRKKTILILK